MPLDGATHGCSRCRAHLTIFILITARLNGPRWPPGWGGSSIAISTRVLYIRRRHRSTSCRRSRYAMVSWSDESSSSSDGESVTSLQVRSYYIISKSARLRVRVLHFRYLTQGVDLCIISVVSFSFLRLSLAMNGVALLTICLLVVCIENLASG